MSSRIGNTYVNGKPYDRERIGRAKCYSHRLKGLGKLRNRQSCDKLSEAGCFWVDDRDGGFCDLEVGADDVMVAYLNKDRKGRAASKTVSMATKGAIGKKVRVKKKVKEVIEKKIEVKIRVIVFIKSYVKQSIQKLGNTKELKSQKVIQRKQCLQVRVD